MFNLNPKEDKFYKMLYDITLNVNEAAVVFKENVEALEFREEKGRVITELEHKGDKLVRYIIEELNNSFITPIDREDIFLIVKMVDDIVDYIDSTTHRFIMFDIDKATPEALKLADMIVALTEEVLALVGEMKNMSKGNKIASKVAKIKSIEHEADYLYRDTIAQLFKNETDVLYIIKWKEIYQLLEDTIDACQKVSSIIEGVVMKHA